MAAEPFHSWGIENPKYQSLLSNEPPGPGWRSTAPSSLDELDRGVPVRCRSTLEGRPGPTGFVEEAAVAEVEVTSLGATGEIEPLSSPAGWIHRETGSGAFVPLSVNVTDPHVAIESTAADVPMDRGEALQE